MNSVEILFVLAGFSYYGTESMYSGTTGLQLEVDVFVGVVYYQRLRHLVSDKFQVKIKTNKQTNKSREKKRLFSLYCKGSNNGSS